MSLRSALRHVFIISYLLVTFGGLTYTIFRIKLPLPWPLVFYSYATMAPFQGNHPRNSDLVAEGLKEDGMWEVIDLQYYIPMGRGWKTVRLMMHEIPQEKREQAYDDFAQMLLDREGSWGRRYRGVRLIAEYWYSSPKGYEGMRKDPYVERRLMGEAVVSSANP